MPESILDFELVEEPLPAPVRISLRIPKSGMLPSDHPYFRKGIRWFFTPAPLLSVPGNPDFHQIGIPPAQEILISFSMDVAGIPVSEIAQGLNEGDRFSTSLVPASGDMMLLSEYFVHEHIRTAPKRDGEHSRSVRLAAFVFENGRWRAVTERGYQQDMAKFAWIASGTTQRHERPVRSGICRW